MRIRIGKGKRKDIAINSWIEFESRVGGKRLKLVDRRFDGPPRVSLFCWYSGAKEFEATKRVYNHPM